MGYIPSSHSRDGNDERRRPTRTKPRRSAGTHRTRNRPDRMLVRRAGLVHRWRNPIHSSIHFHPIRIAANVAPSGSVRLTSDTKRSQRWWTRCDHAAMRYSITASARERNVAGRARPSAFAAPTFTTSSDPVACSTGNSSGRAPLRILSTEAAARRNRSGRLTP
jgi:hypothetical protein